MRRSRRAQAVCSGRRDDRRDRGAFERLGAGTLELRDVRVLDAEQRVALSLPRVYALALAALAARARAALRAAADRRRRRSTSVATPPATSASPGSTSAARTRAPTTAATRPTGSSSRSEFVIRGGTVRWIDEQRQAPPLVLDEVDVVIRNGLRAHDIRLDATPPRGLGRPLHPPRQVFRSRCSRAPATGGAGAAACSPTCRGPTCASCAATSPCRSS